MEASIELTLDFEKSFISKSIGVLLQENLQQNDIETLNRILKWKKAQYQEANSLLCSVLRALVNLNEREESEFVVTNSNNIEDNHSQELPQHELQQNQIESNPNLGAQTNGGEQSSNGEAQAKTSTNNKKKELCWFYARGHCNPNKDC